MSETREQTNVMIGYLLQVMYERGEMLRKDQTGSKEGERHASIIHSIARSISILREDFGYYDRKMEPEPQPAPDAPQAEPAEWDQEQDTDEPQEEPQPT